LILIFRKVTTGVTGLRWPAQSVCFALWHALDLFGEAGRPLGRCYG